MLDRGAKSVKDQGLQGNRGGIMSSGLSYGVEYMHPLISPRPIDAFLLLLQNTLFYIIIIYLLYVSCQYTHIPL